MLVIVAARPTEVACRFATNGATPYQRQAIHTEYTMRTVPSSRVVSVLDSGDTLSFLTDLESSQLISDPPKSLGPLLSAYSTTLSSLLDKHAPIVNKLSRRQSPSNPWFSAPLRAFRSTLRHAENIWKRSHSAADWSSFESLRNQYEKLILSSKKEYFSSLVSSASDNPKRLWQTVNKLLHRNPLHRFPLPLLALHLQTALLPFSQAKYPNSVFLSLPTLPHHLRTHPCLLPLPLISQSSPLPQNPKSTGSCPAVQTSNVTQIRSQPGFLKSAHQFLFHNHQYCQPFPHLRPVSPHTQGIRYLTTA